MTKGFIENQVDETRQERFYQESQIKSSHFHNKEKGCEIKFIKKEHLNCAYCTTHQKETCRCGWEWEWHYGKKSIK